MIHPPQPTYRVVVVSSVGTRQTLKGGLSKEAAEAFKAVAGQANSQILIEEETAVDERPGQ